jgi:hypothetical protein
VLRGFLIPKGKGNNFMAAGINYHLHCRTSYSKDGYILLWKIDPQAEKTTKEKIRKMTKKEIQDHVKFCDKMNKEYWLNNSVIWG